MNMTSFSISVMDAPDDSGQYRAELLGTPITATSPCRSRAAMACLLAALEQYPPPGAANASAERTQGMPR